MVSRNTWHQGRCTVAVDEAVLCLSMQGCGSVCFAQRISRVCSGVGRGGGQRRDGGLVAVSRMDELRWTMQREAESSVHCKRGSGWGVRWWCYMAGRDGRAPADENGCRREWMREQDKGQGAEVQATKRDQDEVLVWSAANQRLRMDGRGATFHPPSTHRPPTVPPLALAMSRYRRYRPPTVHQLTVHTTAKPKAH